MKLELRGITKRFGPVVANDGIDLTVLPSEIHGLLGENGAGKSTLMNVLYGLLEPDGGTISVDDRELALTSPNDAMAAGIGMVHQHFMLVPVFTVAENVMLGAEQTYGPGFLDLAAAREQVREVSERYGFDVDPDAVVEDLPVGVQQRVEIIKALVRDARVLILDEPTAVLTPQETDELIDIMRQLKAAGTSIVFITHKLREMKAVADRITVIRLGAVVGEASPDSSENELASMMVGRAVSLMADRGAGEPGDHVLQVDGLTVVDGREQVVVDDVSFDVRAGEILAVAGVQGNGQTELVEAILGLQERVTGSARLDGSNGTELLGMSVRQVLHAGVGFIPEDRKVDGLVGQFTVAENLILDLYDQPPFAAGPRMKPAVMRDNARQQVREFDIRTDSINTLAGTLSGGNQQKLVVARELSRPLKLLIAAQPTRGLDVGSIEFVHSRMVAERDRGTAVLIVSTELDEVSALADRILVMCRGRVIGIVPGDTNRDVLGLMMAGLAPEDAKAEASARPDDRGAP
ncbi:ABC transporter ATP-binding protein [Actinobacteria bacterium YIM 96077]|uniref:Heme ABC transporter ATP-binding protein n=1 Tax=Phytoactinopolyspora halophila TaxID=1981511 RepID=A0A329QZR1_9ACTN|nr:ABC transporter ATP-binding protein [Phytoactinopolyspora halophila]AYY13398.1 ABC transporter ATP-binding protein [Actinobacteria bacterium YIM 96077]RAW17366.1 heme ABC transporter ATP-binding protein [Phytoactinopolyspora halophila]